MGEVGGIKPSMMLNFSLNESDSREQDDDNSK